MITSNGFLMMRLVLISWIVLMFLLPFFLLSIYEGTVLINETQSMRGTYFLKFTSPVDALKVGDIIVFEHDLYPNRKLVKRISHLEGELFSTEGGLFEKESLNKQKYVPKNHVAVIGDHKYSFDSRYERFGFIDLKKIEGKAWKLF
ncbi:MAG: hypothetical protein NEHIOOID_01294 [Holosporales bacterium]